MAFMTPRVAVAPFGYESDASLAGSNLTPHFQDGGQVQRIDPRYPGQYLEREDTFPRLPEAPATEIPEYQPPKPGISAGNIGAGIGLAGTAMSLFPEHTVAGKAGTALSDIGGGVAAGATLGPAGAVIGGLIGAAKFAVGEVKGKQEAERAEKEQIRRQSALAKASGAQQVALKNGGIVPNYAQGMQEGGQAVPAVLHEGEVVLNEKQQNQVMKGGTKAFKKLMNEFETKEPEMVETGPARPTFISPDVSQYSPLTPDYSGINDMERSVLQSGMPDTINLTPTYKNGGVVYQYQKGGQAQGDATGQLYQLLLKWKVKNPKAVLAQAIHETNNFQSNIFTENKNPFGMKNPKQRQSLSRGENRGHAVYESLNDAVRDYAIYQREGGVNKFIKEGMSDEAYIDALQKAGYATDKNYADSLKTGLGRVEKEVPVETLEELYKEEEPLGIPRLDIVGEAEKEARKAYVPTTTAVAETPEVTTARTEEEAAREVEEAAIAPEEDYESALYSGSTKGGGTVTGPIKEKREVAPLPIPTEKTARQRVLEGIERERRFFKPTVGEVPFEKATAEEFFGERPKGGAALGSFLERNAINLALLAPAIRGAAKDLPRWEIPEEYVGYLGKLKGLAEQPITAEEEAGLRRRVSGERAAMMGQFARFSPQQQLAVAPALTQRQMMAELDVTNVKEGLRRKYLSDYGTALGQYVNLDRQMFEDKYQEQIANKQASSELLGNVISGIRQEEMFQEYYGPGTYFQGLQKAQLGQALEDINLTRELMARTKATAEQRQEKFGELQPALKQARELPTGIKEEEVPEELRKFIR